MTSNKVEQRMYLSKDAQAAEPTRYAGELYVGVIYALGGVLLNE